MMGDALGPHRAREQPRHHGNLSCPGQARASAPILRTASIRAREPGPRGHTTCSASFDIVRESLRWVHASRVYPTCAHLSADLGQARDRCLAEFTLGPREARTRGLARDTRAEHTRTRRPETLVQFTSS